MHQQKVTPRNVRPAKGVNKIGNNEMCINRDQGMGDGTPVWHGVSKMKGKVREDCIIEIRPCHFRFDVDQCLERTLARR